MRLPISRLPDSGRGGSARNGGSASLLALPNPIVRGLAAVGLLALVAALGVGPAAGLGTPPSTVLSTVLSPALSTVETRLAVADLEQSGTGGSTARAGRLAGPVRPVAGACQPRVSLTDPLQDKPWALKRLQPERTWPLTRGAGVIVAVIDSGVSSDHPLLADKVMTGTDLLNSADNGMCDESKEGHGTLVGAIIGARDGRNPLYYGMAPDAMVLPFRVLPSSEKTNDTQTPDRIAQAIRAAVDQRAKVINLSLTTGNGAAITAAVKYAQANDVLLVAASGNDAESRSNNGPSFPAAFPGVLAVGGVDKDGNHVKSSTTGAYLDVAAPGLEIVGPAPAGGGYGALPEGGTSFAAPYVAGLAALIRSYYPGMSADEVARRITETADHPAGGWNAEVGYGVINPYRAVTAVLPNPSLRAGAGQVGAEGMPPMADSADPMHRTRLVAGGITGVGMVLALAIVLMRAAVRRGRIRGWRPGRRRESGDAPT